jgi:hypothetical protein
MGLTGMKYGFLASFYREETFFSKTEGVTLWVLSRNLIFFKTHKKLYTTPKHVIET